MFLIGDATETLRGLASGLAQTCVTSPPYWGLRDYGTDGQIGLETTPEEYVAKLVDVFREVRRVLKDDGTLWLNLGDSYATQGGSGEQGVTGQRVTRTFTAVGSSKKGVPAGLKPKDLVGIPWRVAFALQADGWWLRSDIVWAKPNPMPESVRDRPTRSHEYLFLLTKQERYFYDADAIAEPSIHAGRIVEYDGSQKNCEAAKDPHMRTRIAQDTVVGDTRNKRDVWTITTQPYRGSHYAVMPEALATPCILAGSRPGDAVLDPFFGSGTVAVVAARLSRSFLGIDIDPRNLQLAQDRLNGTQITLLHTPKIVA